jgi:hypothetical protein
MVSGLLELLTGRDDLERVAFRRNFDQLTAYLQRRTVYVPQEPDRFLEPDTFTQEELIGLIEQEATELSNDPFYPWVIEEEGRRWLPAFSSQKKMQTFSGEMSKELNMVFALRCAEVLLFNVLAPLEIDFIKVNPFSKYGFEIGVASNGKLTP